MSIHVNWYDRSQTIIHIELVDAWDWTDYHQVILDCVDMLHSVPHQVNFIGDIRQSDPLPGGALQEVRRSLPRLPHNWGITAVVPHTLFLQTVLLTFQRIYPNYAHRFFLSHTIEEALAQFAEYRMQTESDINFPSR
jgi:hypothetical protein